MRRGVLENTVTPAPLGVRLPGLYQEPDLDGRPNLGQRFLAALDDVLAPVFLALDALPAYLDPELAPSDFLEWLGGWLGLPLDERWSVERRRTIVARATALYQFRGTVTGIAAHIEAFTGVVPEVTESGGASWSTTPEGPLPGESTPRLTVRVRRADFDEPGLERLRALVESIRPAHVTTEVVVA